MSDIDLSAPEVQEAINAAVEKATSALVAKRDELLGEVKKLRKNAQIEPAELERVEAERDAIKAQLSDLQKASKKAMSELEAERKAREAAEGSMSKLLVDNGLSEALAKAGVTNPVHAKAAKAMLSGQVQLVADGDARVAKVGDKALADFITEWASGDEGKHFVTAPDVTGGGSQGGNRVNGTTQRGDLGGSKAERQAAIAAKFNLPT